MGDGRGVIAIPAYTHGRWSAFRPCLTDLLRPEGTVVKEVHGCSDAQNRHELAKFAVEQANADWVFWLDDDTLFHPDVLYRTLAHPQDLVVGLSFQRRPNKQGQFDALWSSATEGSGQLWNPVSDFAVEANGCKRLGSAGFGGFLTRRPALDAVGQPYFQKHPQDPFNWSTDIDFCWRAARAGLQTWGDPAIRYGHIAEIVVWPHERDGQWATVLARGFDPFAALPRETPVCA